MFVGLWVTVKPIYCNHHGPRKGERSKWGFSNNRFPLNNSLKGLWDIHDIFSVNTVCLEGACMSCLLVRGLPCECDTCLMHVCVCKYPGAGCLNRYKWCFIYS